MSARQLGDMLGQTVSWDGQRVKIGSKWFTPWKVENGQSFVSIRDVAEALGYTVGWDNSQVKIYKAAEGGIFTKPAITQIAEAGGSEVAAPLTKLLPMIQNALMNALASIRPNFSFAVPSAAMAAGETILNLNFTGPITVRSDDDIIQVSNRLGGLVRSAQRAAGRRR
jgi:hypothetical protein